MQSCLICSYRKVKQGWFHPAHAQLKFKRVEVIESSTVLKDSIGGPKATQIRSIISEDTDILRFRQKQIHSFVISEHPQDLSSNSNPVINLNKVEFKIEFGAPIPSSQTSEMMDQEESPIYVSPRLELVVHESTSAVPLLIINQDTIYGQQLFSPVNRMWFEILLEGKTSFNLSIDQGDGILGFAGSPTGDLTTQACIKILKEWVSPRSTIQDGGATIFLPHPADMKKCLEVFYGMQIAELKQIQEFLQASIPKLNKEDCSTEENPDWPQIQDGVQKLVSFVDTIELTFQGISHLVKDGAEFRDPIFQKYQQFKQALQASLEDPWLSKSYLNKRERVKRVFACFEFLKWLPWDIVEEFVKVLRCVDEGFSKFLLLPVKEMALIMVLRMTLLASNSRKQLEKEPLCKFVSKSLSRDSLLTQNNSEMFKNLVFCRDFAVMLDESNVLRIWSRGNTPARSIHTTVHHKLEFDPLLNKLTMKVQNGRFSIVRGGLTSYKYHIIDIPALLSSPEPQKKPPAPLHLANPVGLAPTISFGLCASYLFQVLQESAADGNLTTKATIFRLSAQLQQQGQTNTQVLDLGGSQERCLLTACSSSRKSDRLFLAFGYLDKISAADVENRSWTTKLGCWELVDTALVLVCLTEIPLLPELLQRPLTGRVALSLREASAINPLYVESRGHMFFLHSPAPRYLLIYAFHKDSFIPVGAPRKQGIHRLPEESSMFINTVDGSQLSLYICKQIRQEPKRFLVKMLLLEC